MYRKTLVVSLIALFALSIGFAGGRVGLTAGSSVPALTASPNAQSQNQNQTKPQDETSDMTFTSVTSVVPQSQLAPVGSGFTYQGRLSQAGAPSEGQFDFVFTLYDALAGGNPVGSPSVITLTNQTVTDGLFTVQLDFGSDAFLGDARWLELAARQTGAGAYSALSPRQPLTLAPYAPSSVEWLEVDGKPFPYNPLRDANAVTTLDSTGFVGEYNSITIGADGLGLISYYDGSHAALKVAHCSDPACTSSTATTLDNGGAGGKYNSITIGVDGLGLISYWGLDNYDLKVAHCSNTNCTSAATATLDSTGSVGLFTSITIGADGLGLISYLDLTNDNLKVAHCSNTACTSSTATTLDSTGSVGRYTSITIGADGLGLISYWDSSHYDLKVAHCSNTACTTATTATPNSSGHVGEYTSITIGADGLGLISYWDASHYDLKVAHCSNTACTTATTATLTPNSSGHVGRYNSITIGADGLGLISYYDDTNFNLKVAHCSNTACTSATIATLDSVGDVGQYTSITIGADGLGLISYWGGSNQDLKVAKCSSVFCVSNFHRR